MPETILAKITNNIEETLKLISTDKGYTFTPSAVEQQRIHLTIKNRYPFIEIIGPTTSISPRKKVFGGRSSDLYDIEYLIIVYTNTTDSDVDTEEPVTKRTQDLFSDIQVALQEDTTRGGNAMQTDMLSFSSVIEEGDNGPEFMATAIDISIKAFIDTNDPTLKG